ncbi:plasma membrane-associated coenzyme Q6 reductase Pga3p [Monosporozyma unispora]|nr:hypothetical protein C6P44_002613 [Kazachstania unispora]
MTPLYNILDKDKLDWTTGLTLFGCLLILPLLYQYFSRRYKCAASLQHPFVPKQPSINPNEWNDLEFMSKETLSPDTALYHFKLKGEREMLKVPTGYYVTVRVFLDGKEEIRHYTPVHPNENVGHLDLIVKTYILGQVSKYFTHLKPGDKMSFKGPMGEFVYEDVQTTQLGLVAGGSGITPILQVLSEYMYNPESLQRVSLIYLNERIDDILLKDELDAMAQRYPQFQVHYVLHYPPTEADVKCSGKHWDGDVGYITKKEMEKYLPECTDDHRLLICGPPDMTDLVLSHARSLGWNSGFQKSKGDCKVFVF